MVAGAELKLMNMQINNECERTKTGGQRVTSGINISNIIPHANVLVQLSYRKSELNGILVYVTKSIGREVEK